MTSRVRRGIALSAVVLATGGLVLYRAPASPVPGEPGAPRGPSVLLGGKCSAAFSGPGVHGMISLSHTQVLSGEDTTVYADVRLVADGSADETRAQVENARVRLELPQGMRLLSVAGAAAIVDGAQVELALGSLFAGDERRVIVELAASGPREAGTSLDLGATASWTPVGGASFRTRAPRLSLLATTDASEVERGKDGAVLASRSTF